MAKKERKGRIFLDYLRNDRLSTAVAPLSPRGREGAPVSMPLHWSQIRSGLDPLKFTIRTAPGLLAKSRPWEDYDAGARSLVAAIQRLTRNGQAALGESAAGEKPKRRASRKPGGAARKPAKKTVVSHRSKSSSPARAAGRA